MLRDCLFIASVTVCQKILCFSNFHYKVIKISALVSGMRFPDDKNHLQFLAKITMLPVAIVTSTAKKEFERPAGSGTKHFSKLCSPNKRSHLFISFLSFFFFFCHSFVSFVSSFSLLSGRRRNVTRTATQYLSLQHASFRKKAL